MTIEPEVTATDMIVTRVKARMNEQKHMPPGDAIDLVLEELFEIDVGHDLHRRLWWELEALPERSIIEVEARIHEHILKRLVSQLPGSTA